MTLERERSDAERQVLELRQELARLKGEPVPHENDKYAPDFQTLDGGRAAAGKKTNAERS